MLRLPLSLFLVNEAQESFTFVTAYKPVTAACLYWDQFKQTMRDFQSELLTDLATTDVQELWDMFASRPEQGTEKFILTRKAGTRDGCSWISQKIRRLMRKRDKLYKRMERSGDQMTQRNSKSISTLFADRAYERYLGGILGINTTTEQEGEKKP